MVHSEQSPLDCTQRLFAVHGDVAVTVFRKKIGQQFTGGKIVFYYQRFHIPQISSQSSYGSTTHDRYCGTSPFTKRK